MSFSETIFLFVLALVIFGPKKLPEIARQIGKALNEFRRASNEFKAQIEHEISNLEVESKKQTVLPPTSAPEGTASRTLNAASTETTTSPTGTSESTTAEASQPATLAAPTEQPAAPANVEPLIVEPATETLPPTGNSDSDPVASAHYTSDHHSSDQSPSNPHDSESVTTQESHA